MSYAALFRSIGQSPESDLTACCEGQTEFEKEDGLFILHDLAGIVERVSFEIFEIDPLQRRFMGGGETHGRGAAGIEGFLPARDTETPAVAGLEAGKIPLGGGGGEIVAAEIGEVQKLLGRLNANGVQADITGAGAAVAIAIKPGHRFAAAAGERFEKDVGTHGGL